MFIYSLLSYICVRVCTLKCGYESVSPAWNSLWSPGWLWTHEVLLPQSLKGWDCIVGTTHSDFTDWGNLGRNLSHFFPYFLLQSQWETFGWKIRPTAPSPLFGMSLSAPFPRTLPTGPRAYGMVAKVRPWTQQSPMSPWMHWILALSMNVLSGWEEMESTAPGDSVTAEMREDIIHIYYPLPAFSHTLPLSILIRFWVCGSHWPGLYNPSCQYFLDTCIVSVHHHTWLEFLKRFYLFSLCIWVFFLHICIVLATRWGFRILWNSTDSCELLLYAGIWTLGP